MTSVSYSVVINGEAKGFFKPTRRLRQGDPLSPYLFLLCAKGFTAVLAREERLGHITGFRVARGGPRVSHLFFADDSILFCKATAAECCAIKLAITDYEEASGQKLNKGSQLFFSAAILPFPFSVALKIFLKLWR